MRRTRDVRILWSFASGIRYPYYPWTAEDAAARFAGLSLGPKDEAALQRHDPEKGWVTTERRIG